MKSSLSLLFILVPFLLYAQDDYCPCEDEINEPDDVLDMFASMDNQINTMLSSMNPYAYLFQNQSKAIGAEYEVPATLVNELNSEPSEEDVLPKKVYAQRSANAKIRIQKRKKARKLRSKTKFKKYRGKCPKL